jgi:hypothetical protein
MIGSLLKQLPVALYRFAKYHSARLLGLRPKRPEVELPQSPVLAPPEKLKLKDLDPAPGLHPHFLAPTKWPVYRVDLVPSELSSDELYKIWRTATGGQKWSQYFSVYQEIFGPYRTQPVRLLEIGVFRGASLRMWKHYFSHPDAVMVGIDIEKECAQFGDPAQGRHIRIGSQTDSAFLAGVVREFGPFDIIIDDGSHCSADIIASFNSLFDSGLKSGGTYFVEDLHANYWTRWRTSRTGFIDMCKDLVEHMHAHYRAVSPKELFIRRPSDHRMEFIEVPLITTMIREIRFFDSMVAIHKQNAAHAPFALWTVD